MGGDLNIKFKKKNIGNKIEEAIEFILKTYKYIDKKNFIKDFGMWKNIAVYFKDKPWEPKLIIKFDDLSHIKFKKDQIDLLEKEGIKITVPIERLLFDVYGEINFSNIFYEHGYNISDDLTFYFRFNSGDAYVLFESINKNNMDNCKEMFEIFKKIILDLDFDMASIEFSDSVGVWTIITYDKNNGFRIKDKDSPLLFGELDID